jgi:hypothetical protein
MEGHCRKGKPESECCGACNSHHEPLNEIDVLSLGPEAVELAKMFDEVSANLTNALKTRARILQMVHEKSAESPQMKENLDKVLGSRHPVLIQFVFGR